MPLTASPEFQVNTVAAGNQSDPQVVALPAGEVEVVWDNGDGSMHEQLYSASGTAIRDNQLATYGATPSQLTTSVTPDGGFLLAYRTTPVGSTAGDIGLTTMSNVGSRGPTVQLTSGPADDSDPSVAAAPDGSYTLAWIRNDAPSGTYNGSLMVQRFSSDGTALGSAATLAGTHLTAGNSATETPVSPAVVRLTNGDYVVAWNDSTGGYHGIQDDDIAFQRLSATGVPLGSATSAGVNPNHQADVDIDAPAVAATSDGGFALAWVQVTGSPGSMQTTVGAEKIAANGAVGPVTTHTMAFNGYPTSVAVDSTADGGFVLSYSGNTSLGNGADVLVQSFDATGAPLGAPATVNTTIPGDQTDADIGVLPDGGYMVAWRSDGQDGDQGGIYQRSYHPTTDGGGSGGSGQTLQASSGHQSLSGGSGDDTLVTDSGPDTLTGGAGADHFLFKGAPVSAHEVTDFTHGVDKLDFSVMYKTGTGATGDLIADGYVKLIDNGSGGTWLYWDTDGKGTTDQWGSFVATLDHITPAQITSSDILGGSSNNGGGGDTTGGSGGGGDTTGGGSGSGGSGQSIGETSGGQHLTGGSGDDTLSVLHGGDTLTGAGGADHFAFQMTPWSPSEITDFAHGTDKLDFSALLQASHYAGSDAVADGYVKFLDNGSGGTWVYFDTDGHGTGDQWGTYVATVDHVSAGTLGAADLAGSTSSGGGSTGGGDTTGGSGGGSTGGGGSGGQAIGETGGGEHLTGGAGDDTLTVIYGGDTITGAGGADHFAFSRLPWNPSEITDFTHGTDRIDLHALLQASGYSGSDPLADGYVKAIDSGSGATWLYYDTDGHGSGDQWGTFLATLDHVSPSALTASDFVV